MTYASSTLGSTATNPVVELISVLGGGNQSGLGIAGAPRAAWGYNSTHTAAEMTVPAIISDGAMLGMRAGDLFFGVTSSVGSSSPICYFGVVGLVTASSGASLSSNFVTSTAV
jgi:hypothetical protein